VEQGALLLFKVQRTLKNLERKLEPAFSRVKEKQWQALKKNNRRISITFLWSRICLFVIRITT
jgi:hypothetical protein